MGIITDIIIFKIFHRYFFFFVQQIQGKLMWPSTEFSLTSRKLLTKAVYPACGQAWMSWEVPCGAASGPQRNVWKSKYRHWHIWTWGCVFGLIFFTLVYAQLWWETASNMEGHHSAALQVALQIRLCTNGAQDWQGLAGLFPMATGRLS